MIARTFAAQAACALLLSASFTNSVADVASAVADCRAAIVDEDISSPHLIDDRCPDLIREIEASPWREILGPDWQEGFSYSALSQLEFFVSYYAGRSSADGGISLSPLDEIVLGLDENAQEKDDESLWERLVNWVSDLLSDNTDNNPEWLSDWLSNFQLSKSVIVVLFWLLSALVIIAAVIVIVTEIRAARMSPGKDDQGNKDSRRAVRIGVEDRILTLADLDKAAPEDKPSILLRLVLQRLEVLGIVAHSPARTHREASGAVTELGSDGAALVSRVSESAERIRFSDDKNQPQEIGEVVSAGIALLERLKPEQV
ncbi:MAG: hypothetical protein WBN61_14665 [Woeseiaceae bacterium]